MKKRNMQGISCLLAGAIWALSNHAFAGITLEAIGGYDTGLVDEDAAEIVAHDVQSQRLFVVNGATDGIDVLDITDPVNPVLADEIDLSTFGNAANSVAVYDGVLAIAIEAEVKQAPGSVVLMKASDLFLINEFEVGPLPDMLTFTPDGSYLLVANEGEPNDDYTVDPEGSISVIDLRGGDPASIGQDQVKTAKFDQRVRYRNRSSIRVFGPNATPAQDFEPEYIAVYQQKNRYHKWGKRSSKWKAMVTLQENNAVAIVDVASARIEKVVGLGFKNHQKARNAIDVSNRDDAISIRTWPVYGMYQPDAIASYTVNGRPYFLIANEGDARDYDGFSEEERVGDLTLDATAFPNAAELQADENLGRLKITTTLGDVDKDGDYDRLFSYGARSFSILNRFGYSVFDSDSEFEFITASALPAAFNSQGGADSFDSRSDDKGSEPEGVVVGEIKGRQYAFIGLERIGGIMIYDVTDPGNPFFVNYSNTAEELGDIAPEGIKFIPADQSPNGKPLLVVGFEFSGTTRIFEIKN
ncbi:MAG: choice-of-anchor I family protein [Granulosicoccus sp.]|nr:choice-of-anchor I family protein [Granulosicoccus sp.]